MRGGCGAGRGGRGGAVVLPAERRPGSIFLPRLVTVGGCGGGGRRRRWLFGRLEGGEGCRAERPSTERFGAEAGRGGG